MRHQLPNADAWVRFRIDDIRLPTPPEVLAILHRDEQIVGQVVTCTNEGGDAFALVRVSVYPRGIIVPLQCLEVLDTRMPDLIGPQAPGAGAPAPLTRNGND